MCAVRKSARREIVRFYLRDEFLELVCKFGEGLLIRHLLSGAVQNVSCASVAQRDEFTESLSTVKSCYRVQKNARFQEIRRKGSSHSNKILVLCALKNDQEYSRFGFSVSSRIGNAVVRNRIKRRLREAMRLRMGEIRPGWDIVFIARLPIRNADYHEMDASCARLLRRAHLLQEYIS